MQWAILAASGLLLIGFVLRARLGVLQLLFVPASVIGGIVGLVAIQLAVHMGASGAAAGAMTAPPDAGVGQTIADAATALASTLRGWAGPLIAVVFAGLLLERRDEPFAKSAQDTALAAIMVWIIALGQVALGLVAAALLVLPIYDVPPSFGQLLEAGFAGGHGTATALGEVYRTTGFPAGRDLGLFVATIGLVYSVISGIVLVNVAVRRGWTRAGHVDVRRISGLEDRRAPAPIALGRVRADVLDPLAFQLVLMALAFLVGALLHAGFTRAIALWGADGPLRYLENIPLFLFTLIGGLLVRKTMEGLGVGDLIDAGSIKRIVGVAMEFLIVAAMASLRIDTVVTYLWPLTLLILVGVAWTAVCLLVLSPRLLPPEYWFELGIINYGMSTGTTAQGMMLLRLIDKDLESGAAEHYALAAPLSAPFIGGGVITMSLPIIVQHTGVFPVAGAAAAVTVILYIAGRRIRRRRSGGEPRERGAA